MSRLATACLLASGISAFGLAGVAGALGASPSSPASADTAAPVYLALGGSASVGYQPTVTSPKGAPTSQGYANDLVSFEASRGVALQLTQLGCPGETTTSMLYGGARCYHGGTQLAEAIAFLQAHYSDQGLVTVDLGFNNVRRCLEGPAVDEACVDSALNAVQADLPTILAYLKSAAGPEVSFVGVGHYDPFLADALTGPSGVAVAQESVGVIDRLNDALKDAYSNAGIPMADVAGAFEDGGVVHQRIVGANVAVTDATYACELTWMCQAAPYGPNLHPNAAGYATIATAIEKQLRYPW